MQVRALSLFGREVVAEVPRLLVQAMLVADGFTNVHYEPAMVPHWVRGTESCVLVAPTVGPGRQLELKMMSLGGSAGTPGSDPIEGDALVVTGWLDLVRRRSEVPGKIVICDAPPMCYDGWRYSPVLNLNYINLF